MSNAYQDEDTSSPSPFNHTPSHSSSSSSSSVPPSSHATPSSSSDPLEQSEPREYEGGRYALVVLTCINLLNYIDRYVPSATKQYFQPDLGLSDAESGAPLTAFVFVYMLFSPLFSYLADLGYKRNKLIASGILIWSVATAAGALAIDFWTLMASRSLVGVGEAAYATIAPG